MSALHRPRDLPPGEAGLDLRFQRVVEAVEQRRMSAAQIREGLEDRRIRPRALDPGCNSVSHPPATLGSRAFQPLQQRSLADTGYPGQEERASTSGLDRFEQSGQPLLR